VCVIDFNPNTILELTQKKGVAMKWMQFLTPAKSIDFSQTQNLISQHPGENITILDVRQPSEYKTAHIPGAVLIPLPELSDRLRELDIKKPVLVY
jgi:3-mercaptopyruvate sulfurtransferase SseA